MSTRALYEEGLATGRRYAEVDLEQHLGTGSPEQILREEAHIAVEAKDAHEGSRDWAAFQLGIIRGYREICRQPSPVEVVTLAEYRRSEFAHERMTGQHDDEGAYEMSDPKHPRYHSTHADIWDMREGK